LNGLFKLKERLDFLTVDTMLGYLSLNGPKDFFSPVSDVHHILVKLVYIPICLLVGSGFLVVVCFNNGAK
jgi:hypothetical protein